MDSLIGKLVISKDGSRIFEVANEFADCVCSKVDEGGGYTALIHGGYYVLNVTDPEEKGQGQMPNSVRVGSPINVGKEERVLQVFSPVCMSIKVGDADEDYQTGNFLNAVDQIVNSFMRFRGCSTSDLGKALQHYANAELLCEN